MAIAKADTAVRTERRSTKPRSSSLLPNGSGKPENSDKIVDLVSGNA